MSQQDSVLSDQTKCKRETLTEGPCNGSIDLITRKCKRCGAAWSPYTGIPQPDFEALLLQQQLADRLKTNAITADKIACHTVNRSELQPFFEGEKGEEKVTLPSGATRSGNVPRYDLICPHSITAIADAMTEGATKHGTNNWTKGMSKSIIINHMYKHLMMEMLGDQSEDHLGHLLANIMMLIHFKKGCTCHESFERD